MGGTFTLPGPETLILFGVQVKVLSALFGVIGVGLGHWMAPRPPQPLGWQRQSAVVAAGLLVSVSIAIATGQNPLVVLGWSIGIGWAGIAIFQIAGAHAKSAARTIGSAALAELSTRLAERKDNP
jgi:hypothetical protein